MRTDCFVKRLLVMSSNGTIKYIRISCMAKVICWCDKANIVILVYIHSVSAVVCFGVLQVSAIAGNLRISNQTLY